MKKVEFDEKGMTKWHWRVLSPNNLRLSKNTQIKSFTVIDAMIGMVVENDVKTGFGCSILSYSSIDKENQAG